MFNSSYFLLVFSSVSRPFPSPLTKSQFLLTILGCEPHFKTWAMWTKTGSCNPSCNLEAVMYETRTRLDVDGQTPALAALDPRWEGLPPSDESRDDVARTFRVRRQKCLHLPAGKAEGSSNDVLSFRLVARCQRKSSLQNKVTMIECANWESAKRSSLKVEDARACLTSSTNNCAQTQPLQP